MPRISRFAKMTPAVASIVLALALLAGCSGNNASCSLQSCTVTFARGVDVPQAEMLGVTVKLLKVEGGEVTLDIAGNQIRVPAGGGANGITVKEITGEQVVVEIPTNLVG